MGNTGSFQNRIWRDTISRLEYAKGVKVVHACIDMGVNFIDTAVAYKDSEIKIEEAILGHDIIATKSQSRDAAGIEKDVNASLSMMNVEFIHIYQIHGINNSGILDTVMAKGGALEALKKMKDEGHIGAIGITVIELMSW